VTGGSKVEVVVVKDIFPLKWQIGNCLDFVIWTKSVVQSGVFTDFTLHSGFADNSCLAEVVWVKFATQLQVCAVLCKASNLSVHQVGRRSSTGIPEILDTEASVVEI
jgi:hypothetical protein